MNNQESLSLNEIKKRAITSFMSLTARQLALRAIAFVTLNIILVNILPLETLGIFNIATAVILFFAFFSDIGLAASLIQKKENVTDEDIKTVFTIQQIIVTVLSLIIIVAAPFLGHLYNLNNDGVWLIRILGIAFFLSSLKVVPAVLLERQLRFQPLVTVEIIENIIFNGLLILLVVKGVGIWSFSIATITRGVAGTLLLYILAPVKVGLKIKRESLKNLLSFGLFYQLNSLLAMLKDRLVPLIVAVMVGPQGMAYITWAQNLAFLPLEILLIVNRITFPTFSRLQEDKQSLQHAVEKSLFITTLLVYPALFGIGAILPSLLQYVISSKMQPAAVSFYLFFFSTFWAAISTTFTNTLNAVGYIKTTLKLMIFWTVITWILTPILVFVYGFVGVALASFIISFTSILTIILVKRIMVVNVLDSILLPTVASFFMGVVIFLFSQSFVKDKLTLGLAVLLGGAFYFILIFLFGKTKALTELKNFRNV